MGRKKNLEKAPDYVADVVREAKSISFEDETSKTEKARRARISEKIKHYEGTRSFWDTDDGHFIEFTDALRDFEKGKDVSGRDLLDNRYLHLLEVMEKIAEIDSTLRDVAIFKSESEYTVPLKILGEKYQIDTRKLETLRIKYEIFYLDPEGSRPRYGLAEKAKRFRRALGYKDSELKQFLQIGL